MVEDTVGRCPNANHILNIIILVSTYLFMFRYGIQLLILAPNHGFARLLMKYSSSLDISLNSSLSELASGMFTSL